MRRNGVMSVVVASWVFVMALSLILVPWTNLAACTNGNGSATTCKAEESGECTTATAGKKCDDDDSSCKCGTNATGCKCKT